MTFVGRTGNVLGFPLKNVVTWAYLSAAVPFGCDDFTQETQLKELQNEKSAFHKKTTSNFIKHLKMHMDGCVPF